MKEFTLDPDYEWAEVKADGVVVSHVKLACLHRRVIPVEAGGEIVCYLCRVCDAQLLC